ncbi:MAG: 2TM domain-containing protein [Alphaproteobacteria bacterium]|jgi:hypothetical protein|nr:2TM domain-containing protein [Alphaproteobacteria bacterium]MDP6517789.1 2TM domain-containing protein [Alphaproteobacteria bacterium]
MTDSEDNDTAPPPSDAAPASKPARGRRRRKTTARDTDGQAAAEAAAEARARAQVQALRSFYNHVAIYAVVNGLLFLIDMFGGDGVWFYWPLFGWGIVLAIHASRTFRLLPWLSDDWEEDKVRELLDRERGL